MRKKIIAGNWKMYKTRTDAIAFMMEVVDKVSSSEKVDSVICCQAPLLRDLVKRQGENLKIGAQNMHFADNGAFTGEVAAPLLAELGVSYVILGHSERRTYYNETDEDVCKKIKQAFSYNLIPIVCVGESLAIREAGTTDEFIKNQVVKAFDGLEASRAEEVVIAYEPIWAIGTGKTATPAQAEETIAHIREVVKGLYGEEVSEKIRIQYGGSVNPGNVVELMACPNIDGALIGGASLDPEKFLFMVKAGE